MEAGRGAGLGPAAAYGFGRGSTALLAVLFFIEPIGLLTIEEPRKAASLLLFAGVGAAIAAIIEELHKAHHALKDAVARADAASERTSASEAGKSLLLRELSHRIRNDLQTLVALLEMQAATLPRGSAGREALTAAVTRTHVLARVHARLARRGDAEALVGTREFLDGLCGDLRTALVGVRPVELRSDVEDHELPLGRAVSLGLVLTELVTNALKHAFPEGRAGRVSARFARVDDGSFELSVSDDGAGPPQGDAGPGGSGLRIARALAARLGGTLETARPLEGGMGCTLRFPVAAVPERAG